MSDLTAELKKLGVCESYAEVRRRYIQLNIQLTFLFISEIHTKI